ncbi:TPA: hypothetical protein U8251_002860 [Pseudomonas putida]|nr:hypothetical protein [Pseudomonas putida]
MNHLLAAVLALTAMTMDAEAHEACGIVSGAILIAQDSEHTFLGKITNEIESESIFNEFGKYGSEFQSNSIWNEFGSFGSEFSTYSPNNAFTSSPPMMIKNKKIIGYLSENKVINGSISPKVLKALCADEI